MLMLFTAICIALLFSLALNVAQHRSVTDCRHSIRNQRDCIDRMNDSEARAQAAVSELIGTIEYLRGQLADAQANSNAPLVVANPVSSPYPPPATPHLLKRQRKIAVD